ncbi:hypothetical protein QWY31_01470 [Cytophagales bacterium LB-30]|uniref:Lipoprotein n=1 Tax=Shiella aurantiaca TaxID=3058365 RepID=A0ABT8F114_9BACT|nr:hypothetical protein [Shiella aurantiaca]MDN4164146.1 hypothetical protein [Shiella aurantiaca]
MNKWMRHLRIILIGLNSVLLFQGCNFLMFDPPEDKYAVDFDNSSEHNILLVFLANDSTNPLYWRDSLKINTNETKEHFRFVREGEMTNDIENIEKASNRYSGFTILLFRDDELLKTWTGPSGYYSDTINSPFNYNSWEFKPASNRPENILSAVTFTITDKDLQ